MKIINIYARTRGFAKSVSHQDQLDICQFLYTWNTGRWIHAVELSLPYMTSEGMEALMRIQKDIYKAFKARFGHIKQPGVAISITSWALYMLMMDEMKGDSFVEAVEPDH